MISEFRACRFHNSQSRIGIQIVLLPGHARGDQPVCGTGMAAWRRNRIAAEHGSVADTRSLTARPHDAFSRFWTRIDSAL